jgi:hypothetical protein
MDLPRMYTSVHQAMQMLCCRARTYIFSTVLSGCTVLSYVLESNQIYPQRKSAIKFTISCVHVCVNCKVRSLTLFLVNIESTVGESKSAHGCIWTRCVKIHFKMSKNSKVIFACIDRYSMFIHKFSEKNNIMSHVKKINFDAPTRLHTCHFFCIFCICYIKYCFPQKLMYEHRMSRWILIHLFM